MIVVASDEEAEDQTAAPSGYGNDEGRGGGQDNEGYLDMGAYSGQNGAFGWYAGHPVGRY